MNRGIRHIVEDIDALMPVRGGDLDRLQALIDEFFASRPSAAHLGVWFRLFERFPEDHGNGVFWAILHCLEAQPGCGAAVVASVRRRPTHYPVMMVNRMLNGGITTADGTDLLGLLRAVAEDESVSIGIRRDAERFIEHQRGRSVR